jgi:hypothetical protein
MDDEQRIRERAHAIWEAEGRPEGCEKDHWQRACRELGINVVAGEGEGGANLGGGPVTVLAGGNVQEEPPYAGVDPRAERTG